MDNSITEVLGDFLQINGVSGVAIVGRDGFVIDSTSDVDVNIDALGAMVATSFSTSEALASEFNLDALEQNIIEFTNGKVLMTSVHDDILAIFAEKEAVIGGVRYTMKKYLPKLLSTLQ